MTPRIEPVAWRNIPAKLALGLDQRVEAGSPTRTCDNTRICSAIAQSILAGSCSIEPVADRCELHSLSIPLSVPASSIASHHFTFTEIQSRISALDAACLPMSGSEYDNHMRNARGEAVPYRESTPGRINFLHKRL
jgi:hypothetical protein